MNRKLAKIALSVIAVLGVGGTITACTSKGTPTAAQKEQQAQNQDTGNLLNNQPVPAFTWSQLRQNTIELENAQANTTQTTTFFFNMGIQDPIQSCPSIGFPIASTTQLTNPNQIVNAFLHGYNGGYTAEGVVGNPDPTGVYTGASTGTYVICVAANGKGYADYWEGFVQTVTGSAAWDFTAHRMQPISNPTATFSTGKNG